MANSDKKINLSLVNKRKDEAVALLLGVVELDDDAPYITHEKYVQRKLLLQTEIKELLIKEVAINRSKVTRCQP